MANTNKYAINKTNNKTTHTVMLALEHRNSYFLRSTTICSRKQKQRMDGHFIPLLKMALMVNLVLVTLITNEQHPHHSKSWLWLVTRLIVKKGNLNVVHYFK